MKTLAFPSRKTFAALITLLAIVLISGFIPFHRMHRRYTAGVQQQTIATNAAGYTISSGRTPSGSANSQLTGQHGSRLPISFEVNAGQEDAAVKFSAHGKGYRLYLTSDEAIVSLHASPLNPKRWTGMPSIRAVADATDIKTAAVHIELLGSNPKAEIAGTEKLPGVTHYYIGNDPRKWRTNVPTYAQVRYRDIYPGVDLLYYGIEGRVEHDFVVGPGADPNAIVMRLGGARRVDLTSNGNLLMKTDVGDISLLLPTVYQVIDNQRKNVEARYELASNNDVRFGIGQYDRTRSLIIDPVLQYSTLLGGNEDDYGTAIAVNSAGEAYVAGFTYSSDFPTKNPVLAANSSLRSAFVSKMNATGNGLIFSTYLGGSQGQATSEARGIALDKTGAVYIAGGTRAPDFPVTPDAYQTSFNGIQAVTVTKLSSTGRLVYSTFVGGRLIDYAYAIAVDTFGGAHITGSTEGEFPTTSNASWTSETGSGIFVTALNAGGTGLLYSGILGGNFYSEGRGIAVDSSRNAYVTGSTDFIPVVNAFQPSYGGGSSDAFVTKISPAGDRLIYSTYFGGQGGERGSGIAVDSSGDAYIGGLTSGTIATTRNAFRKTKPGGWDGFIIKLNPSGGLLYSSYIGGSGVEDLWAVAVDQYRTAYVAGVTVSPDFPLYGSLRPFVKGDSAFFVTSLVPSGEQGKSIHYYSTLLGPEGCCAYGEIWGIALDPALNAYVTGYTWKKYPVTPGAFQTELRNGDSFISKLVIAADLGLAISASPVTAVQGNNLTYTLVVSNKGPDWAQYLKLNDPIPPGTSFVSYNAGGGACTAPAVGDSGTLNCTLPRLDKDAAWYVRLVVKVNATGGSSIVNAGHVRSNMQDFVWQNNYGRLTTAVGGIADSANPSR